MFVLFVWLWLFALGFRALDATLWVIRAGRHLVVIYFCFLMYGVYCGLLPEEACLSLREVGLCILGVCIF